MRFRVPALLLAAMLLWSSLATLEGTVALAPPEPASTSIVADAGTPPTAFDGSVEHHHLDDLPSQPHTDTAADAGVLPGDPWDALPRGLGAGPPAEPSQAHLPSPPGAGPLRPPRPGRIGAVAA